MSRLQSTGELVCVVAQHVPTPIHHGRLSFTRNSNCQYGESIPFTRLPSTTSLTTLPPWHCWRMIDYFDTHSSIFLYTWIRFVLLHQVVTMANSGGKQHSPGGKFSRPPLCHPQPWSGCSSTDWSQPEAGSFCCDALQKKKKMQGKAWKSALFGRVKQGIRRNTKQERLQ